ncbi:MAG TPA: PaaI family thioesterase [Vicinamibacterales bacterium]|nr:PaaI family thioesterase [Vicinamibacterales bacterium]
MPVVGEVTFPQCYVCGQENERGLKVRFSPHPAGGCRAEYVARAEHVGWPEVIHGGLLFTLMDEAVAWAVIYAGLHGVTARAEAKFRAPARVGMTLVVRAWLTEPPRRVTRARAELREAHEDGPLVAELDAVMAISKPRP